MKLDYMQRLTLGVTTAKEKLPKAVLITEVAHDSWCGINKGNNCTCTPDITIRLDSRTFEIDEEGVLHERK